MTLEIPLGRSGLVALIDDADLELVSPFRWQIDRNSQTIYAWHPRYFGYPTMMHQLVMGAIGIDHIDGDGLNNQRCNLRVATIQQNNANRRKQPGTSSIYKGVSRRHGKWDAYISFNNRTIHLGRHAIEADAARAYDRAAVEYFGEFARPNFPLEAAR